jgi:molybdopterin converting factor small subunit
MLDVRFYGTLRRFAEDPRPDIVSRREIPVQQQLTVRELVERLGIAPEELGHIFLNNRLLMTVATMNLWLNYLDAGERVPAGHTPWDTPLRAGDRVALFGQDMALLVV